MRKHSLHWVIFLVSYVVGPFYAAHAADIEWRGFLSTGASFSDSNTPYIGKTQKKVRVSNETFIGLNLSKELDDSWRVAAQFIARAEQADSTMKADWAFVSYDPPNPFDVTLGKQKIPLWMMSAYMDVGRAYPWVIPPEEVYNLFNIRFFTGIAIGYSMILKESSLNLKIYGGDTTVESRPSAPTLESKLQASNLGGASIEWTWNKLLLRSAINQAIWDLDLDPMTQYGERRYRILTHGLRFEYKGFLVLAEFANTKDLDEKKRLRYANEWMVEAEAAAAAGDSETAERLFAQAALNRIRIGGSEAFYTTIGRQIQNFFPHLSYADLKKPFSPGMRGDQRSLALGLNYDINVDSVIKAEARRVSLPADSRGLFSAQPSDSRIMVYRLSYSLIF